MANVLRGEIALPGTDYTMRLTYNALCELESELKKRGPVILDEMEKEPSFILTRAVVWAALRSRHPEMTITKAGEIIQEVGFLKIGEALSAMLPAALGVDAAELEAASAEAETKN